MIDTIVLTLKNDQFKIFKHEKFSPSTEGLYSTYYSLGGRANIACKQNPTPSELKQGIYKPRLTVTKRMNRERNYDIVLKIEFSIPKLLFGNNFDEVQDSDFERILALLDQKINEMGIYTSEEKLRNASVSAVHYSKNIVLIDYSTPYTYLKEIYKTNINQKLDLNQTDFRNGGHSVKYRANTFEVAFYDKLKDLEKAKVSGKRAEEQDNELQLQLFEIVEKKKPFEVIRMEVRLNRKQKIKQIFSQLNIPTEEITFQSVYSKDKAQKVLLHYINEIENSYPALAAYHYIDASTFLAEFIVNNPKSTLKHALYMLGLKRCIDEIGVREFRELIKKFSKRDWYKLYREIKSVSLPLTENVFEKLKQQIRGFKPLSLVDFQEDMLNNDKYS